MKKNTLFIRVDSSTKIGYGHFIRCMALADTLKKNFEINFISRSLEGNLISNIQQKGFTVFRFYSNSKKINIKNDAQKTIAIIRKYGNPSIVSQRILWLKSKKPLFPRQDWVPDFCH